MKNKAKKLAWLLAIIMLLGVSQFSSLTASAEEPNAETVQDTSWNLLDKTMDNYTADWKVVKGKEDGIVTQKEGYVNIEKGNDSSAQLGNPGPYIWLCPNTNIDLPADGTFSAEVTLRMAGEVTPGTKAAEFSARLGTGSNDASGRLYSVFLEYGTQGWISVNSNGTDGVTLDTTQWHNYGLVVNDAGRTYSVYVDGKPVIENASSKTYKGGDLFRLGMDSEARGNMDVKAVRIGEGDLSDMFEGEEPPVEVGQWNILDHKFAPKWDSEGFRASSKVGTITQEDEYVNILKPASAALGDRSLYHWIVSPAGMSLPRDGFTLQTTVRLAGEVEGAVNEIGVRMGQNADDLNGKLASVFLGYGKEGFISNVANGTSLYTMTVDTTQWHTLTMVVFPVNEGYCYDLYVDKTLAYDNAPLVTYKGGDLIRFGTDNGGRCNMDVKDVSLGSGVILPDGVSSAKITNISLSETSQKENESGKTTVTVTGKDFTDGEAVSLSLVNKSYDVIEGVTANGSFKSNVAEMELHIPAGLKPGQYYVQAKANNRRLLSDAYAVISDREAPVFPTFTPSGFTIEMEDYIYNHTQEFNFPSIVDTKDHPVKNELGDYRYYLFYAPHDAPGGCCVAVSNSLDGPWVEYGSNPVVAKEWPKEDGSGNHYKVSHVSSPYVVWNDIDNCWFMYFHGENNITRYATSDDLLNWTYGDICVVANDFSPSGSGFNEASYAKVFEHQVPGLDNKYIMLLMITGSGTGGHRNIYWAHSKDGKDWTAVTTSLLDPMMDSEYKGNFSGPYFMEWDGRYYVICHASSGNMYAFEVGESLDYVIPWGVFYNSKDSINDDAEDESAYPDYGRSGAPSFIQDDDGIWHMFYEGGRRLHANIVHAKGVVGYEKVTETEEKIQAIGTVTLDSKKAIDAAREAYDALTDAQKKLVSNYDVLLKAEETYAKLASDEADKVAAKMVEEKIEKIGTVTLDSKKAIDAAREAYDALTDIQKKLVSNYDVLLKAEETYAKLVSDEADKDDANNNDGNKDDANNNDANKDDTNNNDSNNNEANNNGANNNNQKEKDKSQVPKTGDDITLILWYLLMLGSGIGILLYLRYKKNFLK